MGFSHHCYLDVRTVIFIEIKTLSTFTLAQNVKFPYIRFIDSESRHLPKGSLPITSCPRVIPK